MTASLPAGATTPADRTELLFIEDNIADLPSVLAGVRAGVEVVVLDSRLDGIAQIAAHLEGRSSIDALHIVSHGRAGEASLGAATLSSASIGLHADALGRIGDALAPGADILLYGCETGAGADGQALLASLSVLSRADVAASTGATGSAALGGNWTLEQVSGNVTAASPFSDGFAAAYEHVLGTTYGNNPLPGTVGAVFARPGEEGTNWINKGLPADASYAEFSLLVDQNIWPVSYNNGLRGKFEYNTGDGVWRLMLVEYVNGSNDRSNGGTRAPLDATIRYTDLLPGDATTGYGATSLFTKAPNDTTTSSAFMLLPDQPPTSVTVTTLDVWNDPDAGTVVATLGNIDTGGLYNGAYTIDAQSQPGQFLVSGNTLVLANGASLAPGQSATVTLRYNDHYQRNADGSLIPNQGVTQEFVFHGRENPDGFGATASVNTTTSLMQNQPAAALLADGSYVVVWRSAGQGADSSANFGIYGRKLDAAGNPVGAEFALSDQSVSANENNPAVAALDGGGYVVAYTKVGAADVVFRIVGADGALGAETPLATVTAGNQSVPAVTGLSGGKFAAAWVDAANSGDVKTRVFNADGSAATGEVGANLNLAGGQGIPAIGALENGGYVVAWRDVANEGDIMARVMTASGSGGGEILVAGGAARQAAVKVAGLAQGGFVVVFQEGGNTENGITDTANEFNIYARIYTDDGTPVGSKILVNANTPLAQSTPSVAALGDGGFTVAWTSSIVPAADNDVFARSFNSDGSARDAHELLVNESARDGIQNAPSLAGGDAGWLVAWYDAAADAAGGVMARQFSTANHAPTLSTGADLLAIEEDVPSADVEDVSGDDPPNWGDDIEVLLAASGFSDADGDVWSGIAISANDADPITEGRWQYSNDDASEFWHDVGAVSPGAALLLPAGSTSTFLRFVPVADYHGRPGGLTVHAVDQTGAGLAFSSWDGSTEVRATFDTTLDDATSPVSANGVTWSVVVTPVNDKPILINLSAADNRTVAASSGAIHLDLGADALVTDVDSADFAAGALNVILSGGDAGDVLAFASGGPVTLSNGATPGSIVYVGGVRVGFLGSNGTGAGGQSLVVAFDSVDATPARITTLLREITFDTTGNVAGTRTIMVVVNDGDGNGASSNAFVSIAVTTNPRVDISSDLQAVKLGGSAVITFAFSDVPTGVEAADFTVSGGVLGELVQDQNNPKVYTAMFTPTPAYEGNASVSIAGGKFVDGGGNANEASTVNAAIAVDTLAPLLVITSSAQTLAAGQSATITFTFSEVPSDFSLADVVHEGGALTGLAPTADPKVYTATFTPAADSASVAGAISVASGAYRDAAGNDGGAASVGIGGDTLAPSVVVTAASTTLKAGEQTLLTFTFSEAPNGFAPGDLVVSGGTIGGFGVTSDPKVYTAIFTPAASDALVAMVRVAGGYTDAIGNPGAASNILVLGGDTLAPSITISSDRSEFKVGEQATISFSFSEVPAGFEAADITVTGGSLGALAATADPAMFTAVFTPDAGSDALSASIGIAAGKFGDASGNASLASNLLTFSGDTRAPVVGDAQLSLSGATGTDGAFKIGDTVTASWNDADATPDAASVTFDLSQFGGSATAAATLLNGVWSAAHTIAAGNLDATGRTIAVTVLDTAGNTTTRAGIGNATLDNQAPVVSAAAIALSGASGTNGTFRIGDTITASWDNAVDGNADIAAASFDFTAFGGAVVAATLNASVWSASHTIAAGAISAGGLDVRLRATDDAGNSSSQAGSTHAALDATRPSITGIVIAGAPTAESTSVDFTVSFSEAVSGVDLADFALATTGQASATLTNVSGSGTTWTVTVGQIAGRGTIGLNLKDGNTDIVDGAGNAIAGGLTGALHTSGMNAVPVIGSNGGGNSAAIELAEGLTAVTTISALDPDGDSVSYSISGGADAALFSIDAASGALRFVQAPSALVPGDAGHDNVYEVEITADDNNGGLDTQSIAVTVLRDLDGDGTPDVSDDDIDNDGRPNSAEDPVPGAFGVLGDGNGDGIADSLQTNVASLATAVDGNPFATLAVGGAYTLTSVSAGPVPSGLPRNVKLPMGVLDFTIEDVTPGGTVEVSIYVDTAQKVNSYFKLDNNNKWVNVTKAVTTVGSKTKITFELKDGGPLDSDGVADGRIVDPGGVAVVTPLITSNGGSVEATVSVLEGTTAVTTATTASLSPVQWSLGGADAALFQIDANGVVSFRAAPDFGQALDQGGVPHDNVYLLDLIASDAFGSDTQTLTVRVQDYSAPPPPPVTIDGVPVTTGTVVNGDGSISRTITIPVVLPTRPEQVGNNTVADIPLATGADGAAILTAQVPTGLGLQVSSSEVQAAGSSLADLIREIKAHTAPGSHDQGSLTGGGAGFLSDLPANTPLLVQTIVPTAAPDGAAPGQALVLDGVPATAGQPLTALVIDTSALPGGGTIQLHNVDFAAIIGAATVTGGAGSQKVWGDSAAQTLFLGADDDVLHGGGGDDIVGSAGGNDRIYGDEGNDIVFGGQGDDYIDGGSGIDTLRLMGASRAEYTMRIEDGAVVMTHLVADADGRDVIAGVELLQYAGQTGTVDFNDSEIAHLVRLYSTAFGRNADTGGMNFWIGAHEKGYSMMEIAHFFMQSDEAKSDFGALSDHDFVTKLYDVAMDRVASAGEVGFWTGHLARGALDRGDVLYYFATSDEKVGLVGVVDTSITTT